MQVVNIKKAGAIGTDVREDTQINIAGEPPQFRGEGWEQNAREFYQAEGKALANAIFDSLPGGTIDQLILEMLTRRASMFRVPF